MTVSYLVLFNKSYKNGPFNLNGLSSSVIQGDDKVEEIRFTKIRRGLFLKMSSTNSQTVKLKFHTNKWINPLQYKS
jgi:hypothetical protein